MNHITPPQTPPHPDEDAQDCAHTVLDVATPDGGHHVVTLLLYRSELDDALVLEIDTTDTRADLRVYSNDYLADTIRDDC